MLSHQQYTFQNKRVCKLQIDSVEDVSLQGRVSDFRDGIGLSEFLQGNVQQKHFSESWNLYAILLGSKTSISL